MLLYIGNEVDGGNNYQLKCLDLENELIIGDYLPIDDNQSKYLHVRSNNHFVNDFNDQDCVHFFQIFNDTIYTIVNNEFLPRYCFNINNLNIPKTFYSQKYDNIMDFFQRLHKHSYAYGAKWFYESKNSYYFSYIYDGETYIAVVSKTDANSSFIFKSAITDMYSYEYPINFSELNVFLQKDGTLFLLIYPFNFIDYLSERIDKVMLAELKSKIKYTQDMNPLLIRVELN